MSDKPKKQTMLDALMASQTQEVRLAVADIVLKYALDPDSPEIIFAVLCGHAKAAADSVPKAIQTQFDTNIGRVEDVTDAQIRRINANAANTEKTTQSALVEGCLGAVNRVAGLRAWRDWIIAATIGFSIAALSIGAVWKVREGYVPANTTITATEYQALRRMSDADIAAALQIVRNDNLIECLADPSICKIPAKTDKSGRKYVNIDVWLEPRK